MTVGGKFELGQVRQATKATQGISAGLTAAIKVLRWDVKLVKATGHAMEPRQTTDLVTVGGRFELSELSKFLSKEKNLKTWLIPMFNVYPLVCPSIGCVTAHAAICIGVDGEPGKVGRATYYAHAE